MGHITRVGTGIQAIVLVGTTDSIPPSIIRRIGVIQDATSLTTTVWILVVMDAFP